VVALNGVSLEVRPGEVLGLIGPNGAGKTTLIDAVTGFVKPSQGQVALDGKPLSRLNARQRARLGIGRSFQSLELFEDMTVRDNLRAGSDRRDPWAYLSDLVWPGDPPLSSTAIAAVREFGLEDDLDRKPNELPYGRRRLVGIARAIATQPSVLMLDEPAAGLDDGETAELGDLIRRLAEQWGLAILLIEHDVGLVLRVCDRIVALDFGRQIAQGTPDEIRSDAAVVSAYLGDADNETVGVAPGPEAT
jgi:sulfate-transporting ATPase